MFGSMFWTTNSRIRWSSKMYLFTSTRYSALGSVIDFSKIQKLKYFKALPFVVRCVLEVHKRRRPGAQRSFSCS